jgi:hypothetical protein
MQQVGWHTCCQKHHAWGGVLPLQRQRLVVLLRKPLETGVWAAQQTPPTGCQDRCLSLTDCQVSHARHCRLYGMAQTAAAQQQQLLLGSRVTDVSKDIRRMCAVLCMRACAAHQTTTARTVTSAAPDALQPHCWAALHCRRRNTHTHTHTHCLCGYTHLGPNTHTHTQDTGTPHSCHPSTRGARGTVPTASLCSASFLG